MEVFEATRGAEGGGGGVGGGEGGGGGEAGGGHLAVRWNLLEGRVHISYPPTQCTPTPPGDTWQLFSSFNLKECGGISDMVAK